MTLFTEKKAGSYTIVIGCGRLGAYLANELSNKEENVLDSCFSFQGKFFHFLTINRHREIEYDLPYPASVFPFLREHFNSLDKGFHKLFLFCFCCGMVHPQMEPHF